jgi:hypothetical protein
MARRTPFGRSRLPRARAIVLGLPLTFVILQLALSTATSRWAVLRDPDYGNRLARLEALVRADPDAPLLLVLGGSRTAVGFRPDMVIDAWSRKGRPPAVFNFSRIAGSPMTSLLYLRRLLARGILPDWLLLEVWPPFFSADNFLAAEDERLDPRRLEGVDWQALERHASSNADLRRGWYRDLLLPWYFHRSIFVGYFAPSWRGPKGIFDDDVWSGLDPFGWREIGALSHARYPAQLARFRRRWAPIFASFRPGAAEDARIREVLELCRARGVAVSLFRMPESSDLRSSYSSAANRSFDEYVERLATEFGAEAIDARDWSPDEDFGDAFHLTASGAAAFAHRFAAETTLPQTGRAVVTGSAKERYGNELEEEPLKSVSTAADPSGRGT